MASGRPAAAIVREFAQRHGADLVLTGDHELAGGFLTFPGGLRQFFMLNNLGIANRLGAIASLAARACCADLIGHFGYRAPAGRAFPRHGISIHEGEPIRSEAEMIAEGLRYAESLGWPVMVKAHLNLNRQQGLTRLTSNPHEFSAASAAVYDAKRSLFVQPSYSGNTYFFMIFRSELRFVFQRTPWTSPDHHVLSDVTDRAAQPWSDLALDICRSFELDIACVEIMADDIAEYDENHVILQIDAAPNISAFTGIDDSQRLMLENLYIDVLDHQRINGDLRTPLNRFNAALAAQ